MKTSLKKYVCDDCARTGEFSSYIKARASGWAVAKDYSKCYCPNCAPEHRRGGANGKSAKPKQWLPNGCEQIKLDI